MFREIDIVNPVDLSRYDTTQTFKKSPELENCLKIIVKQGSIAVEPSF